MNEKLEARRSLVRVVVTYMFAVAYIAAAGYLLFVFTADTTSREAALAVFTGLGAFATAIVGFWFGTRQSNGAMPPADRIHSKGEI